MRLFNHIHISIFIIYLSILSQSGGSFFRKRKINRLLYLSRNQNETLKPD